MKKFKKEPNNNTKSYLSKEKQTGRFSKISSNTKIILFWSIVALIGYAFWGYEVCLGIILAGIISLVLWKYTINSSWKGIIEDIKTERVSKGGIDEEDPHYYQDIKFAYIRLDSGKIKKTRAHPDWKKGDKIVKEKGNYTPYISK
jgi:hypothetical protein